MSLALFSLFILLLLIVWSGPGWPHAAAWGYAGSGGLTLVFLIVLFLVLLGKL